MTDKREAEQREVERYDTVYEYLSDAKLSLMAKLHGKGLTREQANEWLAEFFAREPEFFAEFSEDDWELNNPDA